MLFKIFENSIVVKFKTTIIYLKTKAYLLLIQMKLSLKVTVEKLKNAVWKL